MARTAVRDNPFPFMCSIAPLLSPGSTKAQRFPLASTMQKQKLSERRGTTSTGNDVCKSWVKQMQKTKEKSARKHKQKRVSKKLRKHARPQTKRLCISLFAIPEIPSPRSTETVFECFTYNKKKWKSLSRFERESEGKEPPFTLLPDDMILKINGPMVLELYME